MVNTCVRVTVDGVKKFVISGKTDKDTSDIYDQLKNKPDEFVANQYKDAKFGDSVFVELLNKKDESVTKSFRRRLTGLDKYGNFKRKSK